MKEQATQQKKKTPQGKLVVEFRIPYYQVPHHLSDLTNTGIQTLALIYLMECSQFKDGDIFCSFATIGKNCHCGIRTAMRTIQELEELGLIEVTHRPGKTNLIKIAIEGVTYFTPRGDKNDRGGVTKTTGVGVTKLLPSNKEVSNKELYKGPELIKLSGKAPPPRDPEVIIRIAKDPLARTYRDIDRDSELIPLESIGYKFPGSLHNVLGKIKGDILDRQTTRKHTSEALKSKSRGEKG